jgi:hypothetical protein
LKSLLQHTGRPKLSQEAPEMESPGEPFLGDSVLGAFWKNSGRLEITFATHRAPETLSRSARNGITRRAFLGDSVLGAF